MPKFILKINSDDETLINNENICCYLADKNSNKKLFKQACSSDKLVLACGENAVEECFELEMDGVLISHEVDDKYTKFIKPLQKRLNKKFKGLVCNANRHEAMIVSEAEPDFVAFQINPEMQTEAVDILRWYGELFLLQSALFYKPELNDELIDLVDFVILNTAEYKILVDKIKRLD